MVSFNYRFRWIVVLLFTSFIWSVYRDIQIEKQYPGDLRNRVVGSRMQLDGLSPYFHHWKPAEGLRYYDWDNYSTTLKVSNATATPFFHQLLYPVANLPQRLISRLWQVLEYLALLVMTVLAWRRTQNKGQLAVCVVSILFLHTYAWLTNLEMGQLYIFIPLAAMVFYYNITGKMTLPGAVVAGLSAAILVLIRPNTVFLLLPFFLLASKYTLRYKFTVCVSCLLLLLAAFGSSRSRFYWSDYRLAIEEQVKLHQDLHPSVQQNQPVPLFEDFEGWNRTRMKEANQFPFYRHSGEHGNVFVLLNAGLRVKTPIWVLSALCVGFFLVTGWLFLKKYSTSFTPPSVALLGSCLYMMSDLCSPVHRFLYNGTFWIFPLLIIASNYIRSISKVYIAAIITGLLLNSLPVYLFPMQHSLGEYVLFAAILGILFFPKPSIST